MGSDIYLRVYRSTYRISNKEGRINGPSVPAVCGVPMREEVDTTFTAVQTGQ